MITKMIVKFSEILNINESVKEKQLKTPLLVKESFLEPTHPLERVEFNEKNVDNKMIKSGCKNK